MPALAECLHQTQNVKLRPSAWLAGSAEATCNHHNAHAVPPDLSAIPNTSSASIADHSFKLSEERFRIVVPSAEGKHVKASLEYCMGVLRPR